MKYADHHYRISLDKREKISKIRLFIVIVDHWSKQMTFFFISFSLFIDDQMRQNIIRFNLDSRQRR